MKTILLQLSTLLISTCLFSQSVGINTDGSAPTAGYVLDVKGQTLIQNSLDVSGNISLSDNQLRLRGNSDGNHWLSYHGGGGFDGAKLYGLNTVALQTSNMEVVLRDSRVGINTSSPSKGVLHVAGNRSDYSGGGNFSDGGHCNDCGPYDYNGQNLNISIYAENDIVAGWKLCTESDARIKNIIGLSSGVNDLSVLNKIRITDYSMKDEIQAGKQKFKKVIAQEVEKVFPLAVSTTANFIPNIYRKMTISQGFIDLIPSIKINDEIKFIKNDGSEFFSKVIEITNKQIKLNNTISEEVFVYGIKVNDFKVVDYDAISMLNVSATQELYKIIQGQKEEIEMLKKENDSLKANVENNSAELELIKMTLNLADHK